MPLEMKQDRPMMPPADLILRIAPFEPEQLDASLVAFDVGGLEHLRLFERALAGQGRSFDDFERLLDFGCGCGRFVRHLVQLEGVEVNGTDIDAEMITWLREHIPNARFEVAPHEPPLPYPDEYFDLVVNHSVFSHLDERMQDLWLAELRRITRPGALLLLTVEGESSWQRTLEASARVGEDTAAWQSELETRGILFIADDVYIGSTHPDFYHSTVHASWYVFEHWAEFFDIAAYMPDGSISQDLIVLRRRENGVPSRRSIRPPHQMRTSPAKPGRRPRGRLPALMEEVAQRAASIVQSRTPPPREVERELSMLRAGLYEQGQRITVLASQLRTEMEGINRRASDGDRGSEGDVSSEPAPPTA